MAPRKQQQPGVPGRGYIPPVPPPQPPVRQPSMQQAPMQQHPMRQQPMRQAQYMYAPRPVKPPKKGARLLWLIVPLLVLMVALAVAANRKEAQRADGQAGQAQPPQQQQAQPQAAQLTAGEIREKVDACSGVFCPGVYVDGISLGGMTPMEALSAVEGQLQSRASAWYIKLTYGENYKLITSQDVPFTTNAKETLQEAWNQGHTGDYDQRYADMARLEQTPYTAYTARPVGDTGAIDTILATVKGLVDRPAKDAWLAGVDKQNIASPFTFGDEEYGCVLDTEPLKAEILRMVSAMESGSLEIVPERIEPAVRKADLMRKYTLRSSATTKIHTSSPEERNNNIRHAFDDFINGYRVEPGKTFSFNKVVGMRTAERGFFPADEIVSGEMVEGYGGGVCQASTTIYQAAVCAGLQIVTRRPHSEKVRYADLGLDATVYLSKNRNKDFVFRNNTDSDIWIFAAVEKDPTEKGKNRLRTRVDIYGEDMGDVWYRMESIVTETIDPPEPEYRKDKKGQYVTYQDEPPYLYSEAQQGCKVDVYLFDTRSGLRTWLYTDEYAARRAVYYEGVKSR